MRLRRRAYQLRQAGMAYVSVHSLLIIAYLQLCRSELVGSWYSANVINEGDFSPKPISEIFSTPPPNFSTANPIVVLSSSTQSPHSLNDFSTYSTSPPPLTSSYSPPSTFSTSFPSIPSSTYSTSFPSIPSSFSTSAVSDGTSGIYSIPTEEVNGHGFLSHSVTSNEVLKFPDPTKNMQSPPNYFVIYQQAPQSIQGFPPSSPSAPGQVYSSPQTTVSAAAPETSSFGSTVSTYQPSTFSVSQSTIFSTEAPEISTPKSTLSTLSTVSTIRPKITTPGTIGTKTPRITTALPIIVKNCSNNTQVQYPLAKIPSLRIRMLTPSGSITNIHINSPTSSTTTTTKKPTKPTTKRPKRTTTTRKPRTTKKSKKQNLNTYDTCVSKCDVGRKSPICAVPLNLNPINPDKLKGFQSICHMACHNSFRKDRYEMLINGRCGKLRTRIKTVDSDKLTKGELNKAQYTIELN